ncbi:MAG TPA: hypothetical protein VFG69_14780 [Nannocystaceae bacterium]|nr:hypothetical protein [Nannocystaceae bacterium]
MTPRSLVRRFAITTLALGLAASVVACKGVDKGQRSQRTVKASIGTFDENADIELAIGDGGGDAGRPDDWEVNQALEQSYPALDACVAEYKQRKGIKPESQLEGDIDFAVKLNGGGKTKPLGVNATISSAKLDKDHQFKDCMREAVGNLDFPKYHGPHVVAKFSTQIDAGSEYIED